MYIAGHLIAATLVAAVTAQKQKIDFIHAAFWMMLVNFIDVDHLIRFRLDDGTANSLILHPLHIFSGGIIFLIAFMGILFPKMKNISVLLVLGLSLHLACDAIADFLHYHIPILVCIDLLMLIGLGLFLYKNYRQMPYKKIMAFFIIVEISADLIQYYEVFILQLKPNESMIPYATAAISNLIFPCLFYFLFKPLSSQKH